MNISLIGMMGSGKTTIGRMLADKLKFSFVDTDSRIVIYAKKSINEIFAENGEEYFRTIESKILKDVLSKKQQVISTGGGIVKKDENIDMLKKYSFVFYLSSDSQTLFERVKNDSSRPLLNCDDVKLKIEKLLKERNEKYELAHYTICTTGKTPDIIVQEIESIINEYCRS